MSTVFSFEQAEDLTSSGSTRLSKSGKYHVLTTVLDPNAVDNDDKPIDGLKVEYEVLDGTEKSEIGKTGSFILYNPKENSKNNGAFAKLKFTRLFVALGMPFEKGKKTDVDVEQFVGNQMVIEVEERENEKSKKKYIELKYAEIYHVDDPAVAAVPKSAESLAMIEPELRRQSASSVVPDESSTATANTTDGGDVSLDDI